MTSPRRLLLALLLFFVCCIQPPPETLPTPEVISQGPILRIGLATDVATAKIGGTAGVRVVDPDEGTVTAIADASVFSVSISGNMVVLRHERLPEIRRQLLVIEAIDSNSAVVFGTRAYRGSLELRVVSQGLVVVNRVELEQYIVGVVSAEMGTRTSGEIEALKAQAVASRTYAMVRRGKWADRGFDLLADVSDQVYTGIAAENALAASAIAATRGEAVTYQGAPIEAFYFSTCSGHTEAGVAAFEGGNLPYLQSVSDLDGEGKAWCAVSPRFVWTESWSGEQLSSALRKSLPANGLATTRAGDLTDVRIVDRTASRRIALLELVGRNGRTPVSGQAIRRVLTPTTGGILRSNDFTIKLTKSGGKIVRLDMSGRGNGHGVGMCQWGAIGRSRAGQGYHEILTTYYPGTEITRMY